MKSILLLLITATLTSCVTSTSTRTEPDGTCTVTVTRGPDAGTVSAVASAAGNYAVNRHIYREK
jgi:hypothetical protein